MQRALNIHANAMKYGGLFTRLHKGEGESSSLVLNFASWTEGVFFSLSREKIQQWSGHGEERKFLQKFSNEERQGKKKDNQTHFLNY